MQPPDKPNDLRLDMQLCFPMYAATHKLIKLYYPALKELGLTYPQYLVMLVLWENNGQMITEIGRTLRLDTGTLTPLIRRLENMQLVERHTPADDRRRSVILLTKQGRALYDKARYLPLSLGEFGKDVGCNHADILKLRDEINELLAKMDQIES